MTAIKKWVKATVFDRINISELFLKIFSLGFFESITDDRHSKIHCFYFGFEKKLKCFAKNGAWVYF